MDKITIPELNETLDNIDELESVLCDVFDEFMTGLWNEEGMTRELNEEDIIDHDIPGVRMYTDKAQKLIDIELKRLYEIAKKYDPEEDYDITSCMYREL